jgi:hypothetical protein
VHLFEGLAPGEDPRGHFLEVLCLLLLTARMMMLMMVVVVLMVIVVTVVMPQPVVLDWHQAPR